MRVERERKGVDCAGIDGCVMRLRAGSSYEVGALSAGFFLFDCRAEVVASERGREIERFQGRLMGCR